MNPPIVTELTRPRAQSTRRMRAIVQSMVGLLGQTKYNRHASQPAPDLAAFSAVENRRRYQTQTSGTRSSDLETWAAIQGGPGAATPHGTRAAAAPPAR